MHSFSHLIINSVVWDIRTSYHMVLLSCAKSFSHIALHILLKVTLASMNIQVVCGGAWCGGAKIWWFEKCPCQSLISIYAIFLEINKSSTFPCWCQLPMQVGIGSLKTFCTEKNIWYWFCILRSKSSLYFLEFCLTCIWKGNKNYFKKTKHTTLKELRISLFKRSSEMIFLVQVHVSQN